MSSLKVIKDFPVEDEAIRLVEKSTKMEKKLYLKKFRKREYYSEKTVHYVFDNLVKNRVKYLITFNQVSLFQIEKMIIKHSIKKGYVDVCEFFHFSKNVKILKYGEMIETDSVEILEFLDKNHYYYGFWHLFNYVLKKENIDVISYFLKQREHFGKEIMFRSILNYQNCHILEEIFKNGAIENVLENCRSLGFMENCNVDMFDIFIKYDFFSRFNIKKISGFPESNKLNVKNSSIFYKLMSHDLLKFVSIVSDYFIFNVEELAKCEYDFDFKNFLGKKESLDFYEPIKMLAVYAAFKNFTLSDEKVMYFLHDLDTRGVSSIFYVSSFEIIEKVYLKNPNIEYRVAIVRSD